METIDKALAIIEATEDGNQLHPFDLKLVERAVNGFLDEEGLATFDKLYRDVTSGNYVSPWDAWYFGIEGLKIDVLGYVYWRGVAVEHYTAGGCWTEEAKAQAEALAARCRRYEAVGLEITPGMIWQDDPTLEKGAQGEG